MIFLRIEPQPSQDEAAAIEAALKELSARQAAGAGKRLRYCDVALGWRDAAPRPYAYAQVNSPGRASPTARHAARSWSALARLEALAPFV